MSKHTVGIACEVIWHGLPLNQLLMKLLQISKAVFKLIFSVPSYPVSRLTLIHLFWNQRFVTLDYSMFFIKPLVSRKYVFVRMLQGWFYYNYLNTYSAINQNQFGMLALISEESDSVKQKILECLTYCINEVQAK